MDLQRVSCVLLMFIFHYTNGFVYSTLCKVSTFNGYVTCDCSSLGLEIIPSDCPSNTSYINLSDNSLAELKPCAFCQSPDVKKLNLDNCPIFRITNTSFAQLDSLRVLSFRHNSIVSFTSNVFVGLSNLRVLKIRHELLASYPEEFWSDLSNISHLYTYDGPKDERFGKFLSAMKSLIYYSHGIGGCRGLYRHYRKINDNKDEYIYDAFVAHSQEDYIWVYGPFRTFLEIEKNFKLALHDRDFVPGKFIADNIIDTIKVSRKIVFVVSRSFLDSEWCQYELDMARMHMFQQNREMLIIILLEDIPNRKLPSRLKQIWEKITCLETDEKTRNDQVPNGDNIFWKRLHLAIKP
ncbi:CD282 [Mytilus edulis]|uniref:TLR2 n=1 Tax=Mytilus edulis TaxID=6550 RepID=A0A8S3SCW5_MYTED|nr:CD282 [Mytilus edulis]